MFRKPTAPVLVLGVGNTLLGDDGVGTHLLHELSRWSGEWNGAVELLEGGTRGLALLGSMAGRTTLILLDAVALGAPPGTIYVRRDEEVLELGLRATTTHEGNAGELLATALLLGELPKRLFLIGIEPARLKSGIGLSEVVKKGMPRALAAARRVVADALAWQKRPRDLTLGPVGDLRAAYPTA